MCDPKIPCSRVTVNAAIATTITITSGTQARSRSLVIALLSVLRLASVFLLVRSVNGFRLHETAVYFECQTQFDKIPWPQKGSAGTFLDPTQPVADRVRVTKKYLSRAAHRRITVLPHPKRVEKHLPLLVGKVVKTVQRSADCFDHRLRRT